MAGGLTQFSALQEPTADQLNAIVPLGAYKSANESYPSNTTMHNDAELFFPVAASSAYQVSVVGGFGCIAASGFKFQFAVPSGSTILNGFLWWTYNGASTGQVQALATSASNGASGNLINLDGSHVEPFRWDGVLVTGASSGTLTFQWAQAASNASATSVFAGTFMTATKIG